jgi:hypothetical protein
VERVRSDEQEKPRRAEERDEFVSLEAVVGGSARPIGDVDGGERRQPEDCIHRCPDRARTEERPHRVRDRADGSHDEHLEERRCQ